MRGLRFFLCIMGFCLMAGWLLAELTQWLAKRYCP